MTIFRNIHSGSDLKTLVLSVLNLVNAVSISEFISLNPCVDSK
jgi:hypothetical protein